MGEQYKHAIVTCARWETDYLTEWLVYHRQIGFDHVYLYCNDDDPSACYQRLLPYISGPAPFVTFQHFPFVGLQMQMYRHFLKHRIQEVDWFIFLDVDEFLVFREDGSVQDFLAQRQGHADFIFFNWLVFGHSGFKERPAGSVLLNYTWRSRFLSRFTKVLTRARALDARRYLTEGESGFWHNWNFRGEQHSRVLNVIGEDMSAYCGLEEASARAYLAEGDRRERIIATAVINHYQFRSEDEIPRRLRRGTLGDFRGQLAFKGVLDTDTVAAFLRQFSDVEDTSLRDYWRYVLDSSGDTSIYKPPAATNIALGKPATQSSTSPWSKGTTPADDAAGVVSGTFTGSSHCHTGHDDDPWWQVDLLDVHEVRQIRIFNRIDTEIFRKRASLFVLETSTDGEDWVKLHQTDTPLVFGGTDGDPLVWSSRTGRAARYVRFRLLGKTFLHIEAVEIYEQPYTPPGRVEPADYGLLTERIVSAAGGTSRRTTMPSSSGLGAG